MENQKKIIMSFQNFGIDTSTCFLKCIDFYLVFSMKNPLIYIFMMHKADILRL